MMFSVYKRRLKRETAVNFSLFPFSSLQQHESARLLATLAFYKAGLTSLVSHNAVEHLLWAVTCSQCG